MVTAPMIVALTHTAFLTELYINMLLSASPEPTANWQLIGQAQTSRYLEKITVIVQYPYSCIIYLNTIMMMLDYSSAMHIAQTCEH